MSGLCQTGWTYYNYKCYNLNMTNYRTWSDCNTYCISLDASMLCITDSLTDLWLSYEQTGWIGYCGNFHWVDGCSSNYTNFASNPNDYECVVTSFPSYLNGRWYGVPPTNQYQCLCEYSIVPTFAPSLSPIGPSFAPSTYIPSVNPTVFPTFLPTFGCLPGWIYYRNNCFKFNVVYDTWTTCKDQCSRLRASMLCITDDNLNTWIAFTSPYATTWIGYSDLPDRLGQYRWIQDDCNSDYTSWAQGNPYNYGVESYVFSSNGRWVNLQASQRSSCGCQYSLNPSPSPTAMPTDPSPVPSSKPTIAPSFGCSLGWIYYNYRCYKFNIKSFISWSACSTECTNLDASMLCITDYDNNNWISSQIDKYSGKYSWIGFSDLPSQQGNYQWVPGCTSTWVYAWGGGEPNNVGVESCAAKISYYWENFPDTAYNYIFCSCEYTLVNLPLPTTIPTIAPPTLLPSHQPSFQPTVLLSTQPTTLPSTQPTHLPTIQPSHQPTSILSTQPSSYPTKVPSHQPSSTPTVLPSTQPTTLPSTQPTHLPTIQPSHQPTKSPSFFDKFTNYPSILSPSLTQFILPSESPNLPSKVITLLPLTTPFLLPSTLPSIDATISSPTLPFTLLNAPSTPQAMVPATNTPTSAFTQVSQHSVCTNGWAFFKNKCYKSTLVSIMSWSECKIECAHLDASMLCITDDETNVWLANELIQNGQYPWIGYSDLSDNQQGDYQWITGCSSTYTNWYPGEPNNLGVGDCVVMTFNGRWDSLPDSAYSYTICSCEYSVSPSNSPSAVPSTVVPSTIVTSTSAIATTRASIMSISNIIVVVLLAAILTVSLIIALILFCSMREKQLREQRIHSYADENIDTEHQRSRENLPNRQRKPTPQPHAMREGEDDNIVVVESDRTIQMDFGVSRSDEC